MEFSSLELLVEIHMKNKRSAGQQMNEVCFLLVKMPNFMLFGGHKHVVNFLFFFKIAL